jgi:SHS2 domain-containing protein
MVSQEKKFKLLEHTADAYIAAYGKTLEEAFENAALATFEVMTDTDKVRPTITETLDVTGPDEKALLYNWLESLLVRFDIKENLYATFSVQPIQRKGKSLRLRAVIKGERFDPKRHPQKVGVKAVTYHRMEISRKPSEVTVKFILDI